MHVHVSGTSGDSAYSTESFLMAVRRFIALHGAPKRFQSDQGTQLSHKWTKNVRNVAVGDIVYLAEAENDDPTYRSGQIVEACPGEDRCVRTVRVQYTNPGKSEGKRSQPKTTTRPIHKVAVVVPVEYVFEDDTCDARPQDKRGNRGGQGFEEGPRQGEGWGARDKGRGARDKGSAARGPQETRETQEVGEADNSRGQASGGGAERRGCSSEC
jgi:hypothetical protein